MNHHNLKLAAAFLRGRTEHLERNENQYKRFGALRVRGALEAFLENPERAPLKRLQHPPLNLLDWRTSRPLERIIRERPEPFASALKALWTTGDADAFWDLLGPWLALLDKDEREKLAFSNAQACLASYLLFGFNCAQHPYYKPVQSDRGVQFLFSRKLDDSTPGRLLADYRARCETLRDYLEAAGLDVPDALSTQTALFLIVDELLPTAKKS